MQVYLEENLKGCKKDRDIIAGIKKAFDQCENDALAVTRVSFNAGYAKTAYVGSCALVAVVHENKLFVANAGDCKGVLLKQEGDKLKQINVSKTFSANKKYEQERLKAQFPNEANVFICKHPKACYVKGGLMPSRSIGDFRLKYREFNFHNFSKELGYRIPIPDYTGPYITHEPDIQVFDLTKDDKWLILATDGLWDEVSRKGATQLVQDQKFDEKQDKGKQIITSLLQASLDTSCKKHGSSRDYPSYMEPGPKKRNIVDDITILVVNLENQTK